MNKLDAICEKCGHRARRHSIIGKHECFDCTCQWFKISNGDPFIPPTTADKEEPEVVYTSPTNEWMQTYTGRAFFPMNPTEDSIHIIDIAHSLSMQCRYNGHVSDFYSVAEHCVLMSYMVPEEDALWALLHDASEAYMGDLVRPVKKHMPKFVQLEDDIMRVIVDKFKLGSYEMPASVKDSDTRIIENERRALLGPEPLHWEVYAEAFPNLVINKWDPKTASNQFINRFCELMELRGENID